MWDLAKTDDVCHWMALRDFAETEMRNVPDWITPQVYLGIAHLRMGEVKTGDRLLESAIRRIGDNPDYVGILPMIEPTPSDQFGQAMRMFGHVPPPKRYDAPTPTPCPAY
jgi:hypothetical protein